MDQLLDAITARFAAQLAAGQINEYHDDEPTAAQRYPVAFVVPQGPIVGQFTVGSPGKVVTTWELHVYYAVPLGDRRAAFRELARIAPLVIRDWLQNRKLGLATVRNTQVGQAQGRGQFVTVAIAGIDHRALLLPLFIEVEETV